MIAQLLRELPSRVDEELIDRARVLDNFHVATRNTNGYPAGAPFEHYGTIQSEQAIRHAGEIIAFAHRLRQETVWVA